MLRGAINNGYSEGYRAGRADREDRWGASDYRSSYAYQDAYYGYDGYYVNQGEYNYHFRERFNRGYQDGYSSRTQYGLYSNGSRSIPRRHSRADPELAVDALTRTVGRPSMGGRPCARRAARTLHDSPMRGGAIRSQRRDEQN